MKSVLSTRCACLITGILFIFGLSHLETWGAETKRIRLRAATLETPPAEPGPRLRLQNEEPVTGLFLIQFEDRYQSQWEADLNRQGVRLLYYVPDDAFVARLDGVALSVIRSMPQVRWVGEYRADYKIHSAVVGWLRQLAMAPEQKVSVMLSPGATARERFEISKMLGRAPVQRGLGLGAVLHGAFRRDQILALLKSPAVVWVEPGPKMKLVDQVSSELVAGEGSTLPLATQDLGFDGAGVTVAVADSGLDVGRAANLHPDLAGRVLNFRFYGNLTDASDGHSHGTHVAGIVAGNGATRDTDEAGKLYGVGVAPGASLVAQRIFDEAGGYEAPPTYETLTREAHLDGAYIGSNSWGDDVQGRYDISAAEFDALVRDCDSLQAGDQPYVLEFSAGNAGPGAQTIGSPAVAKNVIATGASQSGRLDLFLYADGIDAMADFSSRGPCEDGRIKPDIVAPGTWIASAKSQLASEDNAWGGINPNYIYQGGTSQAGPHASGAAAVLVQYFQQVHQFKPSPAMVKAMLINSAVDMDNESGTESIPNQDEGWGRIDLTRVIGSSRDYQWVDQSSLLTLGQVYERRLLVTSSEEEFKVTLVYTDVPGFPGAVPALVNDLDLEVVDPDGLVYRGNQFVQGESVAGAPLADTINNVEGVHLLTPRTGEYVVRVRARNVAKDARKDTPAVDQDFALVISGKLPTDGLAALLLDRPSYTAPSAVQVTVFDPTQATKPSVAASVFSTTESLGENILLRAKGGSGLFTGSVAVVTGVAVADGKLQVANGDTLEARYQDGAVVRRATARADLVAPVISNVVAKPEFVTVQVTWQTDEDASSILYFGELAGSLSSVTNRALVKDHDMSVSGLSGGKTYRFAVVSVDAAGNARTNNNGGAFFTFVAPKGKSVLLVNHYYPDLLLDTVFIPVSTYTDALNQVGVSYDVWDHPNRGEVPLSVMQGYRVVMWRINDFDFGVPMTSTELRAVTNFVGAGGSFFMSSMEGLSRITDSTFQNGVAHVSSFDPDLGAPVVAGVDGDPVSDGMAFTVNYSDYPDFGELGGPDFTDHLTPTTNAVAMFLDSTSGKPVGVRYPADPEAAGGRTVFLSFPLDGISMGGTPPDTRGGVLRSVLSFLAPGADGIGTLALNNRVYSIPSVVRVEVGDTDLEGQTSVSVVVRSDTEPAGQTVVLTASKVTGVFRGNFSLVSADVAAGPGVLRVKSTDTVRVEYLDASSGGTVVAEAVLDVVAPTIDAAPTVTPDYESATVEWSTSEPADTLVQFGETTRLGRTAFLAGFDQAHTVELQGLTADKVYYFKVTSRDQAGNAVEDDNAGKLYTFKTKTPRSLPWTDDIEGATQEWSVFDGEETQSSWKVVTPKNSLISGAHSPTKAWASNPSGGSLDFIETFLISPAMFLQGGNRATLKFWHAYDFFLRSDFEIIKGGELFVITNNATAPITLLTLTEDSSTWVEEEVDLTPYIGNVVYLVWKHTLLSLDFESIPQPGWTVDDVSVKVDTVQFGSVTVSNNLAQAKFVVTGPVNRSGSGTLTVISNASAGLYTVKFGAIQDYLTPPDQSGTLEDLGSLVFQGIYTYADVNKNGLSDAWEERFFGTVAANHAGTLDTDQDGETDAEEFQAGTDPTRAESVFRQQTPRMESNGDVTALWSGVVDREYRVMITHDFQSWVPVTGWVAARATSMSHRIPANEAVAPLFIRIEVRP